MSIKSVFSKLESLKVELEKTIEQREGYLSNRTDKWQSSERGAYYEELTDTLNEMIDQVSDWSEELEEQV